MAPHKQRTFGGGAIALGSLCVALAGCAEGASLATGDGEGSSSSSGEGPGDDGSSDGGDPARSPVDDPVVPLDVAAIELEARCLPLDAAPLQRSVSPEGHLWLRESAGQWRVLDPFGRQAHQSLSPTVAALRAWSADHAFVIDAGTLWSVHDELALPLGWPASLPEPTALCGDPSSDANGFVLADGLLQRDRGQWWEWTLPSDEPWADVAWLADNAGTCVGPEGELWLARRDGEVWRVTGDEATRVDELHGAIAATFVEDLGVAAVHDDALVVGQPHALRRHHFEAGAVQAVSGGGDTLWIVAAGALFRMQDGEVLAAHTDGAPIDARTIMADAGGGVWLLDAPDPQRPGASGRACHLRPSPPIRVEGVHNLERVAADAVEIAVQVHSGTALSAARLDGEPLAVESDGIGHWIAAPVAVGEGWHELELLASGSRGATTRTLRFEQRRVGDLTWSSHVEPLFQEHCAGAACHGPDLAAGTTRPDLSTYEAWIEREEGIVDRVVIKGDMPPYGARKDSWGLDAQLTISEWFESGAARGEQ